MRQKGPLFETHFADILIQYGFLAIAVFHSLRVCTFGGFRNLCAHPSVGMFLCGHTMARLATNWQDQNPMLGQLTMKQKGLPAKAARVSSHARDAAEKSLLHAGEGSPLARFLIKLRWVMSCRLSCSVDHTASSNRLLHGARFVKLLEIAPHPRHGFTHGSEPPMREKA